MAANPYFDPTVPSSVPPVNSTSLHPNCVKNESGAKQFLSVNGWTNSMQSFFVESIAKIACRYFICDDSGSMSLNDGSRLVKFGNRFNMTRCSRWSELTDALKFHANLSFEGKIASEFRFLNASAPLRIGFDVNESREQLDAFLRICDGSPNGGTPLCHHIQQVAREIEAAAPNLRATGQLACVVIATDGEASDGNVSEALRPLKNLPALVVLRLCTNEDKVVTYWNNVDDELELNMDVLDDLRGEAEEIFEVNPWLTYGEPLHRMREFGVSLKEMDMLDEKLLSLEGFKKICKIILGDEVNTFTPPEINLSQFLNELDRYLKSPQYQIWDTRRNALRPWIRTKYAKKVYRVGGCTIS